MRSQSVALVINGLDRIGFDGLVVDGRSHDVANNFIVIGAHPHQHILTSPVTRFTVVSVRLFSHLARCRLVLAQRGDDGDLCANPPVSASRWRCTDCARMAMFSTQATLFESMPFFSTVGRLWS